jgi:DNA polymerase III subunit gamma/tau
MMSRAPAAPSAAAGGGKGVVAAAQPAAPAMDWRELCAQVEDAGQLIAANLMRDWLRVIELAPGRLVYQLSPGLSDDPAVQLRDALRIATGTKWQVERGAGQGSPSLREEAEAAKEAERARVRAEPLVEAAFAVFPGAELIEDERAAPGAKRRDAR